ncbi:MAG: cbb3-type cytochrome oxidase assembly protein CcoS [Rudaea sp.]|nr:cbb3-type cytochrome oxidase assembly protein CcoS [Rudaea sp.]
MNIILVLIPLSLLLLAAGVWAFFWGVNHAQFDDLETPALMPLSDDPHPIRESDVQENDDSGESS